MPHPEAPVDNETVLLAQQKNDARIAELRAKLAGKTFNADRDAQLVAALVEGFSDSRGMTRLAIAETLGEVGKSATPYLTAALSNHPNPVVRRASGKTLTLTADRSTVPVLIHALLNDEDTVVKGSAIGALARMGEAAVPELLKILEAEDTPEATKGHAAWALAFIGAEAMEPVYAAIASESPEVRAAVVGAVSNIAENHPEDRAFQLLIDSLNDPSQNVRSEAASALGKLAYQPAVLNLLEMLNHPVPDSRKGAALALMKIGDLTALDPLKVRLEQESEENARKAIALAISLLQRQSEEEEENSWE